MDGLLFDVIIGWAVVSVVRLIWFLLLWPWTYVAIGVWFLVLAPLNDQRIKATAHEYPQTLELVSAKPDSVLLPGVSGFIPTVTLDFRSTYLHPYDPKAVMCVISGPVYYAARGTSPSGKPTNFGFIGSLEYKSDTRSGFPAYYLGVRQMTVHLMPLADLPADHNYDVSVIPAAARDFFFEAISSSHESISYVIAEPWPLLPDDTVEKCKIGEHIADVADIKASMKWVGPHTGSLNMLRTKTMASNITEQVQDAYRKLYGPSLDGGGV